ncbi:MAG: tetratricopeptide repeat protein [Desulfovibrio sp.]|nr:MAG: tetratricopeptide repeat protein [Desulfovibrio sp.]
MVEERSIGIYSTRRTTYIGAGMTRRKNVHKIYWSVWERDDNHMTVQPLNQNLVPSGSKRLITRMEFEERYTLEPDFFADSGGYKVRRLWEGQEQEVGGTGEALEPPEPAPGEFDPYSEVLERPTPAPSRIEVMEPAPAEPAPVGPGKPQGPEETEKVARADFGRGLILARKGDRIQARKIFEDVACMDGDFVPRHKHMFNSFGVDLRKTSFYEEALMHYGRALELGPDDENLYHNMARLHYERGDVSKALQCLDKSLDINPLLRESRRFKSFLTKKKKKRRPRFKL